MSKIDIVRNLLSYVKHERMWIFAPFFVTIGVLSIIALLVKASPIFLPFIYAGF